jgi:hypothetical protein
MDDAENLLDLYDWRILHHQSTIVDLHAHPSLKASLFYRSLGKRVYPSPRAFDPLAVRTNFPRLIEGGIDVVLSVIYAPEGHAIRAFKTVEHLTTSLAHIMVAYFTVANEMMDVMENTKKPLIRISCPMARFAHNIKELEATS